MRYYPIFLRVADQSCVIIGGGRVAEQKAVALLQAGARLTIISPTLTPHLTAAAAAGAFTYHERGYRSGDLNGAYLAFAATDDPELHTAVARDARTAGVLLNVVDHPSMCDFITPSIMQRGDLVVATSTGGTCPAFARRVRHDIEEHIGLEYAATLDLLGRVRRRLTAGAVAATDRKRILAALIESPLIEYMQAQRLDDVDALLARTVGAETSLAALGVGGRA